MKNSFNLNKEEKNRIRGLHLNESIDRAINPEMVRCENCDHKFQWREVPSGWDENYCENCNEERNTYECMNCREEVENPDTWCSKYCYQEYYQ